MFYKKKPAIVDANQWDGTLEGAKEIIEWARHHGGDILFIVEEDGNWTVPAHLLIDTLGDNTRAIKGDWVIRGTKNEFYPVAEETFHGIYEPIHASGLH